MRYLPALLLSSIYLSNIVIGAPAPVPAAHPAGVITPAKFTYMILSADIDQPWTLQDNNHEEFNFTVAGFWAGALPVTCSLAWDAGAAKVTSTGVYKLNASNISCSDPNVKFEMERYRVEPWFLWQLSIYAK